MLGIKEGVRIWYVSGITNMRYGKYRLFSEVEAAGGNPYNGDAYCIMSKNCECDYKHIESLLQCPVITYMNI